MKTKTNSAARRLVFGMSMVIVSFYRRLVTLKTTYLTIGLLLLATITQASIEITNTINPIGSDCNGSIEITITADAGYELAEPFIFNGIPQSADLGGAIIVQTIDGLCEGTHEIIVENFFGCQKVLAVHLSCGFDIQATFYDNCDGTGGISLQEIPGPTPTFSWMDAAGNLIGDHSSNLNNVPFGEYCVEVRNTDQCYSKKCFILEEIPFNLEVALTTRPTSSPTASDGVIELEILEPVAYYTVEVTGDCPYSNVVEGVVLFTFDGLCRGMYEIKVMKNSCEAVFNATIDACLDISINPPPLITGTSTCDASDGSIDFWGAGTPIISGGTPPYTLEWSNGVTGFENYNLPRGMYDLTITDANGCNNIFSYEVAAGQAEVEAIHIEPAFGCENNTGAIEIELACSLGDVEFRWKRASGTEVISTDVGILDNLSPGEYCVEIIANGVEIPLGRPLF